LQDPVASGQAITTGFYNATKLVFSELEPGHGIRETIHTN
jgi:hypothetical protein